MYFWSGSLLSGVSWEVSAEARLSLHLPPIPYEIVLACTCHRYLTRLLEATTYIVSRSINYSFELPTIAEK